MTILNWDDEELESKYSELEKMFAIVIESPGLTDRGLAMLAGCTWLKELQLLGTRVTDTGLSDLSRLTNLEWVVIDNAPITDSGIEALNGLDRLQGLQLMRVPVTESSLCKWRSLDTLEYLELLLPELGSLNFLEAGRLPRLERVRLGAPQISDDDFSKLAKLTNLKSLVFDAPQVRQPTVEALSSELPTCEIQRTFELSGEKGYVSFLRHCIELSESGETALSRRAFDSAISASTSHPAAYGVRALTFHYKHGRFTDLSNDLKQMMRLSYVTSNKALFDIGRGLSSARDAGRLETEIESGDFVEALLREVSFPEEEALLLS